MRYLIICLLIFGFVGVEKSNAVSCLPSCASDDGRFLEIAGTGLVTIAGAEIVVNIVSTGPNLEFSIFDGEAGENWDVFSTDPQRVHLQYELHADPMRDGSGLAGPVIATWTSDGSSGINTGTPMLNNDWSDFTFPNDPTAESDDGSFVYSLRITPINVLGGMTSNNFKIRTPELLYVPAMLPIAFIGAALGQEADEFVFEDLLTLYPDAFCDDATCSTGFCGAGVPCDPTDPACCFFNTTYDGSWIFFMQVPAGEAALDIWDGDFDFGLRTPLMGPPFDDTDDPNTTPALPPWSIGTDVLPEQARGARPPDNIDDPAINLLARSPNVFYTVIDPLGNQYVNNDVSANQEWELFRLDTMTADPTIADVQVPSIPEGLWVVRIEGTDLSNLNSIVLPFDLLGVDENGDPPVGPPPPTSITLTPSTATNELGIEPDHTVTAFVQIDNVPQQGLLVNFEIIAGPNQGQVSDPNTGECTVNDDCTTDANGMVSWTYSGTDIGTDTIVASFFDEMSQVTRTSNNVSKTWVLPPRNVPTLNEWGLIGLTSILMLVSLFYLKRRQRTA